jgi:hypothetical protein
MTVRAVTYYEILCDAEGCDASTETVDGGVSAWRDKSNAVDQWVDFGGVRLPDGRTFCEGHKPPATGQVVARVGGGGA